MLGYYIVRCQVFEHARIWENIQAGAEVLVGNSNKQDRNLNLEGGL